MEFLSLKSGNLEMCIVKSNIYMDNIFQRGIKNVVCNNLWSIVCFINIEIVTLQLVTHCKSMSERRTEVFLIHCIRDIGEFPIV